MNHLRADLRVVAKLGEGSFAEVFKVKQNGSDKVFAVKRLKKRYHSVEEVKRLPEILSLQHVQGHPNVIDLVDLIYEPKNGYVAMVFELMDCNAYELISEHITPFTEQISLILVYQLLSAVEFMHSKGMFHRDIKPENCMINKDTMTLKLADFGSTRGVASTAPYTEYVATRWYRAPECILTSGSYGPQVDEWAVGCMLYEFLTAHPLFPGKHEVDQIARIHALLGTPSGDVLAQFSQNPNTQISFVFPERYPQDFRRLLPRKTSEAVIDLIKKLLIYNPQDRISAAEALRHSAFREIRESESNWRRTDQSIPFSSYFLNPRTIEQRTTQNSVQPVVSELVVDSILKPPVQVAQEENIGGAEKLPKLIPAWKSKMEPGLAGSRMKAGQRIKEWQQKNGFPAVKKPLPARSVAFQFSKPSINAHFEKPTPELLAGIRPDIGR
jgi:renal tumor antigen